MFSLIVIQEVLPKVLVNPGPSPSHSIHFDSTTKVTVMSCDFHHCQEKIGRIVGFHVCKCGYQYFHFGELGREQI